MLRARPSPALAKRLRAGIERIGIVHFSLNTFTDREWGYGDESPALFNPKGFDADAIVRACKDGGLQGLILVCKHHDGFCLWRTKTTTHSIAASPFRGGDGDLVRELAEACARHGLLCGFYVSPWDRNSALYGTPAYVDLFRAQLLELFGGDYGPAFEMWFDGANGGDGWYGGACQTRKIPDNYYDFDKRILEVRRIQPDVCVMANWEGDFHWPGNEDGFLDPEARAAFPAKGSVDLDGWWAAIRAGLTYGTLFRPAECDVPLRPGWFYHASEDGCTKTPEYLLKLYLQSVGNGGSLNLGIAPNRNGILTNEDVAALRGFNTLREAFFACETARGAFAPGGGDARIPPVPFSCITLTEDLSAGEQIDGWYISLITPEGDERILFSGRSIGIKRIRLLPEPILAPPNARLRFLVTASAGDPRAVSFVLHHPPRELVARVEAAKKPAFRKATEAHLESADAHTLVYSLETPMPVSSLRFEPDRTDLAGTPISGAIETSDDGLVWIHAGAFRLGNVEANPIPQQITLHESHSTRFIRLRVAKTLHGATPHLASLSV